MGLADHVALNFNNNMSTADVFLNVEKAYDTTWHSGLLYKLSELEFSTSPFKLIASFVTERNFKFFLEGEFCTPRKMATGVPQVSVLVPVLYSLHTHTHKHTHTHTYICMVSMRSVPRC
jgi:hypothetical protein